MRKHLLEFERQERQRLFELMADLSLRAFENWETLPVERRREVWPRLSKFNKGRIILGMIAKRDQQLQIRRIYA